jgi:hypothetical protein
MRIDPGVSNLSDGGGKEFSGMPTSCHPHVASRNQKEDTTRSRRRIISDLAAVFIALGKRSTVES